MGRHTLFPAETMEFIEIVISSKYNLYLSIYNQNLNKIYFETL